jgi:hypothetical protein
MEVNYKCWQFVEDRLSVGSLQKTGLQETDVSLCVVSLFINLCSHGLKSKRSISESSGYQNNVGLAET